MGLWGLCVSVRAAQGGEGVAVESLRGPPCLHAGFLQDPQTLASTPGLQQAAVRQLTSCFPRF